MNKKQLIRATVSAFMAIGLTNVISQSLAQDDRLEKCYGVAAAGKNDCNTKTHSCAGKSKVDKDPNEWMLVAKGSCEKMGGSLKPGTPSSTKTSANLTEESNRSE